MLQELKRIKQVGAKWGDNRGLFGDKAGYAGYDDSGAWICRITCVMASKIKTKTMAVMKLL